jgi:hypothetical protein
MEALKVNSIKYIFVFFILFLLLYNSLQGQILPYEDSNLKVEKRVEDLIKRMTIEEKVNQMLKLNLAYLKQDKEGNITKESLENLFHGESIGCLDPPIIDVDGIAKFSEAADQYLRKNTRLGIPAIQVELSGLHGQLAYGATNFPQTIGQGSTWNPELIRRMAEVITFEASVSGCDQAFSPLFDLARDPRYGRVEECFGEDPYLVAEKSNMVVLVIGGTSMSLSGTGWGELAGEGAYPTYGEGYDRAELTPPGIQPELIRAIYKTRKPILLIMVHGRAYSIKWEKEHIPAILEAWYPGEEGDNAVARILFGKVVPSGRLTVSVPQSVGHVPVFYNYKPSGRGDYHKPGTPEKPGRDYVFSSTDPLFSFGFGLSYTQFEYSDLKIEQKKLKAQDTVKLSVKIKNTGAVTGKEVVQVYIHDIISSVTTPVEVLKGFRKTEVNPKETKTLSFCIPCEELGLWDKNMNYVIEPGEFEIMIGASAEDIRLTDMIILTNK